MAGVSKIIEEIFAQTKMAAVFSAMDDGPDRLRNMEALYQHAAEFESWGRKDLARFVEHLEIMDRSKLKCSQSKLNAGCVSITSIHKSKGLEYPVVFLCGLSRAFSNEDLKQKVFSHKHLGFGICAVDHERRVLYPTISKKAIKYQMISERNSEEMRVLYVAMTRPMDRLIMTYAGQKLREKMINCVVAQNLGVQNLIAQQVNCMGDWVLLSAVKRLEAGELFALGGNCDAAQVQEYPWLIRVVDPPNLEDADRADKKSMISKDVIQRIKAMQGFAYPHMMATAVASKQTATQRNREQSEKPIHFWRKPGRASNGGNVYGNLIHGVMEHLDFSLCKSAESMTSQLDTLVCKGLLSSEERDAVDISQLTAFFDTELGRRLSNHKNVLREFQFSILDEPEDPALAGEKVLLQGVVDCALIDEDGIEIIDFKTDRVTDADADQKVALYESQIRTYAKALSRIYKKPVKGAWLYFFRLGKAIPVK